MSSTTLELKFPFARRAKTAAALKLNYSPALDGLRGMAIIAVLAVHTNHLFGWSILPGGNIGVDIFFTLSGYLITRLLLEEESRTGSVSLSNFYWRRVLRLLPALLLVVIFLALFSDKILPAQESGQTRNAIPIALVYASDFALATSWKLPLGVLQHTWSLAIEEHFYLLWPPVLVFALRRRVPIKKLLVSVLVVAFLSAVLRFVLSISGASPLRTYYGMDTRCDALLIGCATGIAVGWGLARSIPSLIAPAVMILVLIANTTTYAAPFMHFGGFTLVALSTAILLINLNSPSSNVLHRVLEFSPLVWIGRISYGIYLWHYPIFRAVGHIPIGLIPKLVLAIAVTFIMSSASFYIIEKPALRFKRQFA